MFCCINVNEFGFATVSFVRLAAVLATGSPEYYAKCLITEKSKEMKFFMTGIFACYSDVFEGELIFFLYELSSKASQRFLLFRGKIMNQVFLLTNDERLEWGWKKKKGGWERTSTVHPRRVFRACVFSISKIYILPSHIYISLHRLVDQSARRASNSCVTENMK